MIKVGLYGPFAHTNHILFDSSIDFIIGGELESTILQFLDNNLELKGLLNCGVVSDLGEIWGLPIGRFSLIKNFLIFLC